MERTELASKVKSAFADLPGQIRVAARFLLDHPQDVALLSMREQARRAGVPPATMTRLAKHLGLPGYEEVRAIYADAIREKPDPFSGRAVGLVRRHREVGELGVAADMVSNLAAHVSDLAKSPTLESLVAAARALARAERIFCVGQRSAFPVAFQFNHILSFFSPKTILLDAPGGVGPALIRSAGRNDVLLAVSMSPSARKTVEITAFAVQRRVPIVAITDSELSSIGRYATCCVVVEKRSPSFFDAITPAFAACEVLIALVAGLHGAQVPRAVRGSEEDIKALGEWWLPADDAARPMLPSAAATRRSSNRTMRKVAS